MSYKRKPRKLRHRRGKGNCLARMKRNGLQERIYPLLPGETAAESRIRIQREIDLRAGAEIAESP